MIILFFLEGKISLKIAWVGTALFFEDWSVRSIRSGAT